MTQTKADNIAAKLADIKKSIQLQRTQVELLIEADSLITKAETWERVLRKSESLSLALETTDDILTKSMGLTVPDVAKAIVAYKGGAVRALNAAHNLDAQIDALDIRGE